MKTENEKGAIFAKADSDSTVCFFIGRAGGRILNFPCFFFEIPIQLLTNGADSAIL